MVLCDLSVTSLCHKGEPSLVGEKVKTTFEAKPYDRPDTITNTIDYFLALWMGSDEFTTTKICGEKIYKQLAELKEIIHPKTGQTLSVLRRTTADGKARRTGQETLQPVLPIQFRKHQSTLITLGDTKVLFEKPLRSVEETDKIR